MFRERNAEVSPETFHFKCLCASLCLCCQSPALASIEGGGYCECPVEINLDLEAGDSAQS